MFESRQARVQIVDMTACPLMRATHHRQLTEFLNAASYANIVGLTLYFFYWYLPIHLLLTYQVFFLITAWYPIRL